MVLTATWKSPWSLQRRLMHTTQWVLRLHGTAGPCRAPLLPCAIWAGSTETILPLETLHPSY